MEGFALENLSDEDGDERESLRTDATEPAVGESDEFGTKANIDAVEEIAGEVLSVGVGVVALTYVDEACAARDDVVDGLLIVVGGYVPERGEVVANAIGNDAEGEVVAEGFGGDDTVESVVEHAVAPHEDYGLVALGTEHTGEPLDAALPVRLHGVVLDALGFEVGLHLCPSFTCFVGLNAYDDSPTVHWKINN